MEARFSYDKAAPGVYKAMIGVEQYLENCGLEESLLHLIRLRASQINGCAYCLDIGKRGGGESRKSFVAWIGFDNMNANGHSSKNSSEGEQL